MEKTIEQLLELSKNPYFTLSDEEQKRLDDFLSKKSEPKAQLQNSGGKSGKSTPATVLNKNKVKKETGDIPKINDSADKEVGAMEEVIHPDAVIEKPEYADISEELADRPAVVNKPTEGA